MSGDPIHIGNHPTASAVNDIDTLALLRLQSALRAGHFANDAREPIRGTAPSLFIGATANPMAPDPDVEISKIRAKMQAGADFFQTQLCYDPARVATFLDRLRAAELPSWPRLLIGVGPFKHLRMAVHMRDNVWASMCPRAWLPAWSRRTMRARKACRSASSSSRSCVHWKASRAATSWQSHGSARCRRSSCGPDCGPAPARQLDD